MACDCKQCKEISYEAREPLAWIVGFEGSGCLDTGPSQIEDAKKEAIRQVEEEVKAKRKLARCEDGCHCANLEGEWKKDKTTSLVKKIPVPKTSCVFRVQVLYEYWYRIRVGDCIEDPPKDDK